MQISIISYACAALITLLGASAYAQSITLSPAVVSLKGNCGQSVTYPLTLENGTDLPIDFSLEAQDVVVRNGIRHFVKAGELADSIAATAVFTPHELHIPSHSSATATVTLTLPPAMRHRAVVTYFRGSTLLTSGNRQATLSLGSLFTFTVSDHHSVTAGALDATPPSASAGARLQSTMVNDGAEPVVPSGMAVILDAGGRMVGKIPFAPRRLLPGEKVTLVADYPGELQGGTYRAVATFDVAGRPLTLIGSLKVP